MIQTHHYKKKFILYSLLLLLLIFVGAWFFPILYGTLYFVVPFVAVGFYDVFQKKHAILRNFPLVGHFRYMFEAIRPEMNQYFIESNTDGKPFSREQRSLVYQRSKKDNDTLPFGIQHNVYAENYEWTLHSIQPKPLLQQAPRVLIGSKHCKQPYSASIFNISAMSFGSLSPTAVIALNRGANLGGFYHNTGEGGVTPYHIDNGGDLVWQIGSGYFGCRTKEGNFNPETFKKRAHLPNVKMIELKLSQGAKPGHGGILPKEKVTKEIAQIRDVDMNHDVVSPSYHKAFSTPRGLILFLEELRQLSGGKPVGFKFCLGNKTEFLKIVKAMIETGTYPDFISIDGGEGGTGAAPLEFSNSIGTPLKEALSYVHMVLKAFNLRDDIKLIASGKVISGFDLFNKFALGADLCNSARGMMFSLGCIQALRCNLNSCPTGVATQDPDLYGGLDPKEKSVRVYNYQKATIHSFLEILAACGLDDPKQIHAGMILRRTSPLDSKTFEDIYFAPKTESSMEHLKESLNLLSIESWA